MENLNSVTIYHLTHSENHNDYPPLEIGKEYTFGETPNPFWAYYERPMMMPVNVSPQDNPQYFPTIKVLWMIKNNQIQISDALKNIGYDTANYYKLLARELLMESKRLEIDPQLPSRQTCLWGCRSRDQINHWNQTKFNGARSTLTLNFTGTIFEADAKLLLDDSLAISEISTNARQYWAGETTENPELELLCVGTANVVEITPPASNSN